MALPKVGVQAVVQDMTKFTRDMNSVNGAIQKMSGDLGKLGAIFPYDSGSQFVNMLGGLQSVLLSVAPEIVVVLGVISALQKVFQAITAPIKKAWEAIKDFGVELATKVWDGVKKVGQAIFDFLNPIPELFDMIKRTASIAFGVLVRDTIRNIGEAIQNLAAGALQAASNFQLLEIRLRGLALRDIIENYNESGIVRTPEMMADAFKQASTEAKELLLWVSRIAIQSPFSTQDVANAFTMAKGFGLTTEMAKSSTEAVMNFAAGMGLSGDQMERILINFGQMWTQGKITGTELRDLARGSLVPTTRIFELMGKKVGKTAAEMRKLASEGKVSVSDFINTFNEMAMTDFPDAAKNMTRTLEGLKEKVKDFGETYFGFFLIKPSLDVITGRLSDLFDLFMGNERFLASIETVGQAFGTLMDTLFNPEINTAIVDKISSALEGIARVIAAISTGDWALIQETLKQLGIPQWVIDAAVSLWDALKNIKDIVIGAKDIIAGGIRDILAVFGLELDTENGIPGALGWIESFNQYLTDNKSAILGKIQDIVDGIVSFITILKTGEAPEMEQEGSGKAKGRVGAAVKTDFLSHETLAGFDKLAMDIHNMAIDIGLFYEGCKNAWGLYTPELRETVESLAQNIQIMVSALAGKPLDPQNTGMSAMSAILQIIDRYMKAINFALSILLVGFALVRDGYGGLTGWFEQKSTAIKNAVGGVGTKFDEIKTTIMGALNSIKNEFLSTFAIPDGTIWITVTTFITKVLEKFKEMWDEMTGNSIIPDMMDEIEDEMVGGFRNTFKKSTKLVDSFVGNMQGSANYARNIPFSSGNNYSNTYYNFDFDANYAQTQSPVTVRHDVEALLTMVAR